MLYKDVYWLLFINFFVIGCGLSTSNKDYDDDDNEDRKHTVSADLIDLFHYGFAQCSVAECVLGPRFWPTQNYEHRSQLLSL